MRIACAPNLRDFGGQPSRHGGHVRTGRLFRAEAIGAPTADEAERLASLGLRLVCDLRSEREVAAAASHWAGAGLPLAAMDVAADFRAGADPLAALRDDPGEDGAVRLMMTTYAALPAACAPHLGRLFARLAGGEHPVLIHCTAGKDRTGFFAAMVLHALGVADEAIMVDYLRSGDCGSSAVVAATRRMMEVAMERPVDEAAVAALCGVRRAYLETSRARIQADFGGIDAYLRDAAGLDDGMHRALIEQLVA